MPVNGCMVAPSLLSPGTDVENSKAKKSCIRATCPVLQKLSHTSLSRALKLANTNLFTVMCLVTWPLHESEAGVAIVMIQTSLLFLC